MITIDHPTQPLTLTGQQRRVLDYLRAFLLMNHQLPPVSKLSADFGWASSNAANDILGQLERRGALQRNEVGGRMLTAAAIDLYVGPAA